MLFTRGQIAARHMTGQTRARSNWRGKLILQVEIKSPNPTYPRAPRPGPYDPWSSGAFCFWRDATIEDLQELGRAYIPNLQTQAAP